MRTETIIKYFNDNDIDNVKDYLDRIIDNIRDISRLVFRYLIYLMAIIFVYYLLQESNLTSLKFSIVDITDLKVIKIFIPPLFAIIYLVVFIGVCRLEELMHQAKVLFNMINKTDLKENDLNRHHYNDFNISFLPFYLPSELTHAVKSNKIWDFLGLLILVIFYLVFGGSLFVFEYYIMKQLYLLWDDSFLVKSVFILTCTLVFLSFFFFFKIVNNRRWEEKEDIKFWNLIIEEQNKKK